MGGAGRTNGQANHTPQKGATQNGIEFLLQTGHISIPSLSFHNVMAI